MSADDDPSVRSLSRPLVARPSSAASALSLAAESDSSGDEGESGRELRYKNRVGRVPRDWYRGAEHIGYDVRGQRLLRASTGDAIDAFLARQSDSSGQRTVYDEVNDEEVLLSDAELLALQRLRRGGYAHAAFDPYADYDGGAFTSAVRYEALGNAVEPKRRFVPSRWEAQRVVRLVHAMRSGWLRSLEDSEEERRRAREKAQSAFLLWGSDGALLAEDGRAGGRVGLHRMPAAVPPPKLALPGHAHSYNPPVEYLLSAEEEAAWRLQEPGERSMDFVPRRFSSMRLIPAYEGAVRERFERALDLYLCPRRSRRKLHIDPQSLIPALPKPSELRPFPSRLAVRYTGHTGSVRSISVHPSGQWLLSGSEDGSVRLWEVSSGRCFKRWQIDAQREEAGEGASAASLVVQHVAFCPDPSRPLLSACVGRFVLLLRTGLGSEEEERDLEALIVSQSAEERERVEDKQRDDGEVEGNGQSDALSHDRRRNAMEQPATWSARKEKDGRIKGFVVQLTRAGQSGDGDDGRGEEEAEAEVVRDASEWPPALGDPLSGSRAVLVVDAGHDVEHLAWHGSGDYFSTTSRLSSSSSRVLLHRLSTRASQSPFSRQRGAVTCSAFHPSQPIFLLATRQSVLLYHLLQQRLLKRLLCPVQRLTSMAVHPSGDHVLLGSADRKVLWYDLDLSPRPYRTLKDHARGVRSVAFHPSYPLFATAAEDGAVHLFHATVYSDLLTNALLVPVKRLQAHQGRAALDCVWHPTLPALFTAGADHSVHLFV